MTIKRGPCLAQILGKRKWPNMAVFFEEFVFPIRGIFNSVPLRPESTSFGSLFKTNFLQKFEYKNYTFPGLDTVVLHGPANL